MKHLISVSVFLLVCCVVTYGQAELGIRSVSIASVNANVRVVSNPNVSTALTIEAWIYPMKMDENESVIFKRYLTSAVSPYYAYALSLQHETPGQLPSLVFKISDGTDSNIAIVNSGLTTIPFFVWTHVAAVYDGNNIRIFINGFEIASSQANFLIPIAGSIRLGINVVPATDSRFFGFIDEVKHWDIPLNQFQIQAGMIGLSSPSTIPGLIGYWKFEEVDPPNLSQILDYSSSGSNGEYRAGATTQSFTPFDPAGIPQISLSPTSIDFGAFEETETPFGEIIISNSGPVMLVGYYDGGGSFCVPGNGSISLGCPPVFDASGSLLPYTFYSNDPTGIKTVVVYGNVLPLKSFDVNNIIMRMGRNGRLSIPYQTSTGASIGGFEWPNGSGMSALYQAGLWLAAELNGELRMGTSFYRTDFVAGPVFGNDPANPSDTKYRTYKINVGDNASTNIDYAEWPADLGAPVNADGTPKLLGDQTLFTVYNDLDASAHQSFLEEPSLPLDAEVKQIVYGYNRPGPLNNAVFIKYIIINHSGENWNNALASFWSDIDIGDAYDDLPGVDVKNNLGFTYNGGLSDAIYGFNPPVVSLHYLNAPTSGEPLYSFSIFTNGAPFPNNDPSRATQAHNVMKGLFSDGFPYINPLTNETTLFPFDGDPVTGTGWIGTDPNDCRILINSAPFSLAAGETIELDFAITVSTGSNNIDALTVMRSDADEIDQAFLNPPPPIYYITAAANEFGTISPEGQIVVNEGDDITFSFTPYFCYQIKNVTVDGNIIGSPESYTFANVTQNHIISVEFSDQLAPEITLAHPAVLWPANHEMKSFSIDDMVVSVSDNCNGYLPAAYVTIDSVSCDEPADIAGGDGTTCKDIVYCDDCKSVKLRAERIGGSNGRVYTVYLGIVDSSGNVGTAEYKVSVPKNQGKDKIAIDDGPAYIVKCNCTQTNMNNAIDGPDLSKTVPRPSKLELENYPNPFNPTTIIRYNLPMPSYVKLEVYNILGQLVSILEDGIMDSGYHNVMWNAQSVSSGIYIYILKVQAIDGSESAQLVKKMLLLK